MRWSYNCHNWSGEHSRLRCEDSSCRFKRRWRRMKGQGFDDWGKNTRLSVPSLAKTVAKEASKPGEAWRARRRGGGAPLVEARRRLREIHKRS